MPDIFDEVQIGGDIFDEVGSEIGVPEKPKGNPAVRAVGGVLQEWNPVPIVRSMAEAARHPIDTGKAILEESGKAVRDIPNIYERQGILGIPKGLIGAIPLVGPHLKGMMEQAESGDVAGAVGRGIGFATLPKVAGKVYGGAVRRLPLPEKLPAIPGKIRQAVEDIPSKVRTASRVGAQAEVMPELAGMPREAIAGGESLFRAAAPVGTDVRFRSNLNAALGDFAEIAEKVDIKSAKGGIVRPDFRVRATLNAIREHLDEMYQNEVVPQISRHADMGIGLQFSTDALDALEFLSGNAGKSGARSIAQNASTAETISLSKLNDLRQTVNSELQKFEKMTPESKAAVVATNPRIQNLSQLDSEIGSLMSEKLKAIGEPGLAEYERRYAGVSSYRNQLERRMNMVEIQQRPSRVLGPIGSALRTLSGRPSMAGASQAASADLPSIGRELQIGFDLLKKSGIRANRPAQAPRTAMRRLDTPTVPVSNRLPAAGETTPPEFYAGQLPGSRTRAGRMIQRRLTTGKPGSAAETAQGPRTLPSGRVGRIPRMTSGPEGTPNQPNVASVPTSQYGNLPSYNAPRVAGPTGSVDVLELDSLLRRNVGVSEDLIRQMSTPLKQQIVRRFLELGAGGQ